MIAALFDFPWSGESAACLLAFGIAALAAAIVVFVVRPLAWKLGAVDVPGGRHAHRAPTARFGGLALLAALLCAVPFALWLLPAGLDNGDHAPAILAIGAFVCLLGACDDIRPLPPSHKLLGLGAAALAMIYCGIETRFLDLPWLPKFALGAFGPLVTVVWVLACTNAVNLIDGVDGLGAGVGLVASAVLGLIAAGTGDVASGVMLFALSGSCAGFLLHNREPARIFLGDSGSLLLGFVLAAVSVSGSTKRPTAVLLVAALCALAVPLFDSTHAFVRRFRRALTQPGRRRILRALKATAIGDRGHLHHRLLHEGLSHRQVARAVALTTLATSLAAMLLLPTDHMNWITVCAGLVAAGFVLWRLVSRPAAPESTPDVVEHDVILPRPANRVAAEVEHEVVLPAMPAKQPQERTAAQQADHGAEQRAARQQEADEPLQPV